MNLDLFNVVCGLITVAAFVFSIYTYYKNDSKKVIEAGKAAMVKERIRILELNLTKTLSIADMIVQLPKKRDVKVDEIQNLARIIRSDMSIAIRSLNDEAGKLENWEFGKILKTGYPVDEETNKIDSNKT